MGEYDKQDRGGASAYDLYLRGMDASMRQKEPSTSGGPALRYAARLASPATTKLIVS